MVECFQPNKTCKVAQEVLDQRIREERETSDRRLEESILRELDQREECKTSDWSLRKERGQSLSEECKASDCRRIERSDRMSKERIRAFEMEVWYYC